MEYADANYLPKEIKEDVPFNGHKVTGAGDATAAQDYVTNHQCKSRSGKNDDGSTSIWSTVFGGLAAWSRVLYLEVLLP